MVRKLAEGGMGVVYEAHQHGAGQFRKTVAVKLIREEYSRRTSSARRASWPT